MLPTGGGSGKGNKAKKMTLLAVAFLERLAFEARGRLPPPVKCGIDSNCDFFLIKFFFEFLFTKILKFVKVCIGLRD